ncbi:MAG: hypothetical protein GWP05_02870 [Anaerolineaceae bacterium]|nr:hypothetical protein [Anaerolineaceae bacterium]
MPRLERTIREINESDDIDFVVVLGNLLASGDSGALDRAKTALSELTKPYYVVLGPEGFGGLGGDATAGKASRGGSRPVGRSLLTWTFRGHGFNGPVPYWDADPKGDLVLVALYTSAPGVGKPGHVDAEQLKWLDRTLGKYPNRAVAILSYHALVSLHPFDNTQQWDSRLIDNRSEVADVLARHDNVSMVLSASHGFAASKVVGRVVHMSLPGLSSWPLAYNVVTVGPRMLERQYVPIGTRGESLAAFERLVGNPTVRQLFGPGERDEERIIQTFGGKKSEAWNLNALRP